MLPIMPTYMLFITYTARISSLYIIIRIITIWVSNYLSVQHHVTTMPHPVEHQFSVVYGPEIDDGLEHLGDPRHDVVAQVEIESKV